jgi:hypothetical protein
MNAWYYEVRDGFGNLKGRATGLSTREEAVRAAQAYIKKNLPPNEDFKITTGNEIIGGSPK